MKENEKVLLSKEYENLTKYHREHSFPKEGLLLWHNLFEFYLNEEFKTAPLSRVYQAFFLAREIVPQLINNDKFNQWDDSITPIQRDLYRMVNVSRLEVILRIKCDYSENKDFEIPELYFRFKFLNDSEYAEGPGDFPDAWEGHTAFVSKIKDKLLEKLVSKINQSTKLLGFTKQTKQVWFRRLMEFYNHSSVIYKSLEMAINLKSLKGHPCINESNLLQNKKPFTANIKGL